MAAERPPTIDPVAAQRWERLLPAESPWLHEEVGRRMEERLQWIKLQPSAWADWNAVRGGLIAHAAVARRYPQAERFVAERHAAKAELARRALRQAWWRKSRWAGPSPRFTIPPDGAVQMVWANMALHMAADPQDLIAQWHRALKVDGFLMFSCLGPDTLREMRRLYQSRAWPQPAHEFTDMHDWGDMLVNAGFAEPVMDMERITLSFDTPQRLLAELRTLGRNLRTDRFAGLRGRHWHAELLHSLAPSEAAPAQPLELTFEVIYGHALRPAPRIPVRPEAVLSVDEMRLALQQRKASTGPAR